MLQCFCGRQAPPVYCGLIAFNTAVYAINTSHGIPHVQVHKSDFERWARMFGPMPRALSAANYWCYSPEALCAKASAVGVELMQVDATNVEEHVHPSFENTICANMHADAKVCPRIAARNPCPNAAEIDRVFAGKTYLLRAESNRILGTRWVALLTSDDFRSNTKQNTFAALLCDSTYPEPFSLCTAEVVALLRACAFSATAVRPLAGTSMPMPWLCFCLKRCEHE